MTKIEEDVTKAIQNSDLLLQDLRSINASCNALVSILILEEIAKVASTKCRLENILEAIK